MGFSSDACWFLLIKTLLIKNNKKREAALKHEAGGDEKRVFLLGLTRWFEDMNFMFSWQEQYLTSERSERVRYCSCHSNIKLISSRHRVMSSIYERHVFRQLSLQEGEIADRWPVYGTPTKTGQALQFRNEFERQSKGSADWEVNRFWAEEEIAGTKEYYVSVKSKLQHPPPPGHTPGIWGFFLPGRWEFD